MATILIQPKIIKDKSPQAEQNWLKSPLTAQNWHKSEGKLTHLNLNGLQIDLGINLLWQHFVTPLLIGCLATGIATSQKRW